MKRCFAIIILLCIFFMAGCADKKPAIIITSNMLTYDNDEKSFSALRGRYEAVKDVIKTEVNTLEYAQNRKIVFENPDDYFLNEDYILSTFDPFNIDGFTLTEHFSESLDQSMAETYYSDFAAGKTIQYTAEDDTYCLKIVSEGLNDVYTVEYSKSSDSFTYRHTAVTSSGEAVSGFLDFCRLSENVYAIQSAVNRCYIQFDSEGHIDYFRFSEIKDGENSVEDSIFDTASVIGKNWVTNNKSATYSGIIEFKDKVLVHSDSSTGTLKEITINEEDYASEFYI